MRELVENNKICREQVRSAIGKSMELRALYGALMQGNNNNNPTNLRFLSAPSSTSFFSSNNDYPVFAPSYKDEPLPLHAHIRMPSQKTIESWDDNRTTTTTTTTDNPNISSYNNKCKLLSPCSDIDNNSSTKHSNIIVPLSNPHHNKSRSMIMSWLLPQFKRSQKTDMEKERLKNELIESNQKRDEALLEVSHMRSSFGELKEKLKDLESYCDDLKQSLNQMVKINPREIPTLVDEEEMVAEFLEIVAESRLVVVQFCKTLVWENGEVNQEFEVKLNKLVKALKPYLNSKHSEVILHHFEGVINQVLFQYFENRAFQKNGASKVLDPQQDREHKFKSFRALKSLTWDEVKRKGTKFYDEEFSRFCDMKMSYISSTLKWVRPWPEELLKSFFGAAKCIWLLHLLAFSFYPPLMILRVEDNQPFDCDYMEDVLSDDSNNMKVQGLSRVTMMVTPGFYVHGDIIRCRVLCS